MRTLSLCLAAAFLGAPAVRAQENTPEPAAIQALETAAATGQTVASVERGEKVAEVRSPDGKIRLELHAGPDLDGVVSIGTDKPLHLAEMGVALQGEDPVRRAVKVLSQESRSIDETWSPVTGKTRQARNHANEVTLHVEETREKGATRRFDLVARAYDDGIAFRYVLPADGASAQVAVAADTTSFIFSGNYDCWIGVSKDFHDSQEWNFVQDKLLRVTQGDTVGMPLLVRSHQGHYLALTEADLTHWAGSRPWRLNYDVADLEIGGGKPSNWDLKTANEDPKKPAVTVTLPAQSPWRVIMIGQTPGDLIQSNLIENLNPPSEIADTSWIKPGIAAWDWWSGRSEMRTDSIKKFIQLAADMGWPYMLIDAGWYYHEDKPDGDLLRVSDGLDMAELRRFAQEKGVRLWLWMSWRDVMRNDAYKRAFPLFEQWGIAGVKIDYMDREDEAMVDLYHLWMRETAAHHLMLDLHGAYKPTGARRTWPNFITQEGVLGNEYNRWSHKATAGHNVTIPYTRGLLGPMDYTPGGFVNQTPGQFQPNGHGATVPNTRGQELAKFVVYESPLMMACDYPDNYYGQPGADFLQVVKTSWDEVRWLSGEVGESVVLARRSGAEWFVGGMTNDAPRSVEVPLTSFLEKGKRYRLTVWKDAPDADKDATKLVREAREVGADDVETVAMAPAGGFVMRLVPVAP